MYIRVKLTKLILDNVSVIAPAIGVMKMFVKIFEARNCVFIFCMENYCEMAINDFDPLFWHNQLSFIFQNHYRKHFYFEPNRSGKKKNDFDVNEEKQMKNVTTSNMYVIQIDSYRTIWHSLHYRYYT